MHGICRMRLFFILVDNERLNRIKVLSSPGGGSFRLEAFEK